MQISSRFTIGVHILAVIDYLGDSEKVTSSVLAGSIGVNPVIVRNVMGSLKEAGIIQIIDFCNLQQGGPPVSEIHSFG